MHNRPLRVIILLSLIAIYPMLLYGEQGDIGDRFFIELALQDPCSVKISGYYLPRKRLKQISDMMKKDNIKSFDGTICKGSEGYDELMIMYQEEIDNNLSTYLQSEHPVHLLDCAVRLNESKEKLISTFHSREIEIFTTPCNDNSRECKDTILASKDILQGLTAITTNSRKRVCSNYNRIAFEFEHMGMNDKAEEIYRTVLRNFDQFHGCFTEAEISLQNMRKQK